MSALDTVTTALEEYPQTIKLKDGQTLELKPARQGDRNAIVKFAKGLDEQDLLFLRVDITQGDVVDNWLDNIAAGETVSILAWCDDSVVGYCTVDRNSAKWTRRVGEIRVNVAPDYRSLGLGRHLIGKIFDIARHLGLQKLTAMMTPDQMGAQAAFTALGFRHEAVLTDHIEDRDGGIHDLAIMSYAMDGLSGQVDAPLAL